MADPPREERPTLGAPASPPASGEPAPRSGDHPSAPPPNPAHHPETLLDALHRAASDWPDRGITLIDSRGRVEGRRTWPAMLRETETAAGRLATLGVRRGDRILVCLPTSWPWFDVWFGAVRLGALPAAVAPPRALGSPRNQIEKSLAVNAMLDARYLVCTDSVSDQVQEVVAAGAAGSAGPGRPSGSRAPSGLQRPAGSQASAGPPASSGSEAPAGPAALAASQPPNLLSPSALAATSPSPVPDGPPARGEDPAFLQMTSGSTGYQRAVVIGHASATWSARASMEAVAVPRDGRLMDALVGWLPLYHDMGLGGCLLGALLTGAELVMLNPRAFLARPWVWLEQFKRTKTAMSAAPNFAFRQCVERVGDDRLASLDLSGWRDVCSGSEMVRAETMNEFASRFEAAGLDPGAIRAAYGMAENTLLISISQSVDGLRTAAPAAGGPEVTSNGPAMPGAEIQIAAPDGRALPAGEVGEIRLRGPGVMQGYWNDPEATAEVLRDGWLYTGDLGFLNAAGEVHITGRTKEILILGGSNVMPHEIEWVAESVLGAGGRERSAAFPVDAPHGEQAILVVEDPGDRASAALLRSEVGRAVGRALGIRLADLVVVRRGRIPRTSSGKVRRRALREEYLRGDLSGR